MVAHNVSYDDLEGLQMPKVAAGEKPISCSRVTLLMVSITLLTYIGVSVADSMEALEARRLQTLQDVSMENLPLSGIKCDGQPSSGWGGLGKNIQESACQKACLADEACMFAVYRPLNGACSSFESCDKQKLDSRFNVWPKRATKFDFGVLVAQVSNNCAAAVEKSPFKVLGCRGSDSRCSQYSTPDRANENFCKELSKTGADCMWAKEDPTGSCKGNDSRCGQDSYKTKWRCGKLASCRWTENQELPDPVVDVSQLSTHVNHLVAKIGIYVPNLQLDTMASSRLLASLVSTPLATCQERAESIGHALAAHAKAISHMKVALNPMTPREDSLALANMAVDSFSYSATFKMYSDAYTPEVFGCVGQHSECKGQVTYGACTRAASACAWATTQQRAGTCEGNDNRCSGVSGAPNKWWRKGCDKLKAQHASCSWVPSTSYKKDLAELVSKLQGVVATSFSDMEVLLSKHFTTRLSALEAAAAAVEHSLADLNLALGGPA